MHLTKLIVHSDWAIIPRHTHDPGKVRCPKDGKSYNKLIIRTSNMTTLPSLRSAILRR